MFLLLQPWYAVLEEMQYLLPDEDSREKVAAESWSLKVDRLKEGTLAVSPTAGHGLAMGACQTFQGLVQCCACLAGPWQSAALQGPQAACFLFTSPEKSRRSSFHARVICRSLKPSHGSARRPCLQSRTASGESYLNWTTLSQLCKAAQTWQQWAQSMSR